MECIAEEFPYRVSCGDSCGENKQAFLTSATLSHLFSSPYMSGDGTLIVVTQSDGTYLLFKGEELCLLHSEIVGLGMCPCSCLYHPPFLLSFHTHTHTYAHAHMHTLTCSPPSFLLLFPSSPPLPSPPLPFLSPPFSSSDGSYSLVVDKSVPIAQLVVAHRHQVLLFRTGTCVISFIVT